MAYKNMMTHSAATFDHAYEAILADTPEARRIHWQVRYEVFCRQRGFEQAEAFPDGEERDAWDDSAVHFLVRERATGHWVGAMRMVRRGPLGFPLESVGRLSDDFSPRRFGAAACEISRLSLIKPAEDVAEAAERAVRGTAYGAIGPSSVPVRDSEIMLGLFRAALTYSMEHAIDHWYVLINRAFARLLKRLGVQLSQAGDACEHRGLRVPFLVDLKAGCEYVSRCHCRIATVLKGGTPPYRRFSELFPALPPGVPARVGWAATACAAG